MDAVTNVNVDEMKFGVGIGIGIVSARMAIRTRRSRKAGIEQ